MRTTTRKRKVKEKEERRGLRYDEERGGIKFI